MHIICPHCRNVIELVEVNVREEIVCPSCGSSFQLEGGSTKGASLAEGTNSLGRFTLVGTVGQGAFGTVYKARDPGLDRTVAIKVPRASNIGSGPELDRFLREARSVAQLRHPSIVSVHEVGTLDGMPYLVSDFVEGVTLADFLSARRPTFREAAELIAKVAEALQYAHSMGVVHRDVKPSNVMLEESAGVPASAGSGPPKGGTPTYTPRLMDFGLAKRDAGEITMTIEGQVLGTPAYMSPEQAKGEAHRVDGRSDVYSLGVIFYELLTGELPFRGNTRMLLYQLLHDDPRLPRSFNDRIPRDLETICLKAMAKETARRYQSAGALASDLGRWLRGEPIHARPAGVLERAVKWAKRRPTAAALLGVSVLVLVALGLGLWVYNRNLEETRQATRAAALVNSLANADTPGVPRLIEDLEPYRAWADPLLVQMASEHPAGSKARLHASLALLPVDAAQVDYLLDRFLEASPQELLVIRAALLPYKDQVTDRLWTLLVVPPSGGPASATPPEGGTTNDRRFRAACALAGLDPDASRWDKAAPFVAAHLVAENPLLVGPWTEALRPVRRRLLAPLSQIALRVPLSEQAGDADPERRLTDFQQRAVAVSVLADFAADQPRTLAEVLLDADAKAFAVFYPKLAAHVGAAVPLLDSELAKTLPADAPDADKDQLAKRQANAAVALLRLGHADKVWPLLKHTPDPSRRSYLIHRFATLGVDPQVLVRRFAEAKDVSVRRALLLALGESRGAHATPLLPQLLDLYRTDPDPGLHAAAAWTLRQWGQKDKLAAIDKEFVVPPSGGSGPPPKGGTTNGLRWFVNTQGQTFTLIPGPVEFLMGSPESEPGRNTDEILHRRRIGRSFAIASTEVTVEQFKRFNPKFTHNQMHCAPEPDCPILGVIWYEAAEYCNWLSRQEGIPEDQWCYVPNKEGKFEEAMQMAADYLQRTGYRLPTEAEWEYACRAGAVTSRSYGRTEELLPKYGWYFHNAKERSWPVGSGKPNGVQYMLCIRRSCGSGVARIRRLRGVSRRPGGAGRR